MAVPETLRPSIGLCRIPQVDLGACATASRPVGIHTESHPIYFLVRLGLVIPEIFLAGSGSDPAASLVLPCNTDALAPESCPQKV